MQLFVAADSLEPFYRLAELYRCTYGYVFPCKDLCSPTFPFETVIDYAQRTMSGPITPRRAFWVSSGPLGAKAVAKRTPLTTLAVSGGPAMAVMPEL
jgi:hypothetical protein